MGYSMNRRKVTSIVAAALTLAGLTFVTGAPPVGAASPKSMFGAGFQVITGGGGVSSASAQFTVPDISCHALHDVEAIYPGVWVLDGVGTVKQEVDINAYCVDNVAHVSDAICIVGGTPGCVSNLSVSPGDRIIASFSESAVATQGEIYDLTTNLSDQITNGTAAPTPDASVFIGDIGPHLAGYTHVPTFTSIPFSKVQVNGRYLFQNSPEFFSLRTASAVQVRISSYRQDGDAFVTSYQHY